MVNQIFMALNSLWCADIGLPLWSSLGIDRVVSKTTYLRFFQNWKTWLGVFFVCCTRFLKRLALFTFSAVWFLIIVRYTNTLTYLHSHPKTGLSRGEIHKHRRRRLTERRERMAVDRPTRDARKITVCLCIELSFFALYKCICDLLLLLALNVRR